MVVIIYLMTPCLVVTCLEFSVCFCRFRVFLFTCYFFIGAGLLPVGGDFLRDVPRGWEARGYVYAIHSMIHVYILGVACCGYL